MNEIRKHNLSNEERAAIIQFLLERSTNKKLHRGAIQEAAEAFNVSRGAISRVWHRGKLRMFISADLKMEDSFR